MPASSVSRDTPRQWVPNLDHLVTQWMSTVGSSAGSAWKAVQSQRWTCPVSVVIRSSHLPVSTRGVGPADSTGKSVTRYCPGGSFSPVAPRRPEKPGDTMPMVGPLHYRPARPRARSLHPRVGVAAWGLGVPAATRPAVPAAWRLGVAALLVDLGRGGAAPS